LTPHISRSTTSIQVDADHRKTGRKISDLRARKMRTEHTTLKETTTTLEADIQPEAEAGAETKIDLHIAYFMRERQTIGQGIVPSS
jgi:hypothetical protein